MRMLFAPLAIALLTWPLAAQEQPGASTPGQSPAREPLLAGTVHGDSGSVAQARVVLHVYGPAGDEVWSIARRSDAGGRFRMEQPDLPTAALAGATYMGRLIVTAQGYGVDSALVALTRQESIFEATPNRVDFLLSPRDPDLLWALLLPAWIGLFLALLNLTTTEIALGGKLMAYRRYHPSVYAISVAAVWTYAAVQLTRAFVQRGQEFVPLGLGEVGVPSILVIGAYLGSLAYVAYSINVRGSEFYAGEKTEERRELLRTQGGRLLVAPYVAVIGYAVLAPAFPGISSSPAALFFGFFTGLYIKVVLEALNGIGKRLLSGDSQARAEARESEKRMGGVLEISPLPSQDFAATEIRYHNGEREVVHPVDRTRIVLRFAATSTDAASLGQGFGLALARPAPSDGYYVYRTGATTAEAYLALCRRLALDDRIVRVVQVLGEGGPHYDFATDLLTLSLTELPAEGALPAAVERMLERHRGAVQAAEADERIVRIDPQSDPFALADALTALPEIDFAEPNLVHVSEAACPYQPACSSGVDGALPFKLARVPEAWTLTSRLPVDRVLIAVLDDGADLTHPDLAGALTVGNPVDVFHGELSSLPLPHDHHGTHCAGVAAARPASGGMQGVGFGARLLVVRVNHRIMEGGDIITTSIRLRAGIDAAVAAGADVLSLSWAAGESLLVRKAILRAATQGRGGKGCVVVAAAGNDGGGVLFPATLSVVIAVAGCDEHGRLMRTTTWASNFGPEVDLTAPAMETFTTDLDGTYTCSFQGTSAATALVAGAAALVLQQNPELTAKEVRDLLLNTADLVHDTANGRRVALKIVNVEAAVRAAQP